MPLNIVSINTVFSGMYGIFVDLRHDLSPVSSMVTLAFGSRGGGFESHRHPTATDRLSGGDLQGVRHGLIR